MPAEGKHDSSFWSGREIMEVETEVNESFVAENFGDE